MAITFNFKYKDSSLFKNGQAAGFIADYINPPTMKDGNRGRSGANLYITSYYIGNAYNDKICLENIENNLLTDGSGKKLDGRTYVEGDLFMNPLNEMYVLVKADPNSSFSFGLKYVGLMKNPNEKMRVVYDVKEYIQEISFMNLEYVTERCMVPVNRGYDSSINDYRHVIKLTLNETPPVGSLNAGATVTIQLNDIDCSAGPTAYDTWNQTCKYKVIQRTDKTVYITGLRSLINNKPGVISVIGGPDYYYESAENLSDASTNGLFYMPPVYEMTDSSWDACTNTAMTYEQAYRGMYGIKFMPIIKLSPELSKTKYRFFLKIYLKNIKHFQNGCFSLFNDYSDMFDADTLNNEISKREPISKINTSNFIFYKCIEIPLIDFDSSTRYYPTFISDYVADKFHPSGNNISINYTSNPNASTQTYKKQNDTYPYHWSRFKKDTTYAVDKRDALVQDSQYQTINFEDLLYKEYKDIHPMIQYYKRPVSSYTVGDNNGTYLKYKYDDSSVLTINYRGGESAYFSGMVLPNVDPILEEKDKGDFSPYIKSGADSSFNQYVSSVKLANMYQGGVIDTPREISPVIEYFTKEMVAREIHKFIFSPDNIYEVVCVDVSTGRTFIVNNPGIIKLPQIITNG